MDAHGQAQVAEVRPITIAVVALGGEGGGVLADWIVDLAQHGGYLAQATSVPGVAQRTGATVYYVELFPKAQADGREPVLALMPVPGDVHRGHHCPAITLAESLRRASHRIDPPRMPGSRHHPQRASLAPSVVELFSISS